MRNLLKSILLVMMVCAIMIGIAWNVAPKSVAKALIHLNNWSAGLTAKVVPTDIGDVHYLEGGQGETIVLIHGIYARKEHWVEVARELVAEYHVIALDLPGFGDSDLLPDAEYAIDRQQAHLTTVFTALGLDDVHIAANSMGAYVATMMVAQTPDVAASFAFIGSPLGVPTQIKSDMDIALQRGEIPLLARSESAFFERNTWLSPDIPYVPGPILEAWMQTEVVMAEKNARIWQVVHSFPDIPTVLDLAARLDMPSLIYWCTPDRVFHVSGAGLLDQALPRSNRITPDNCGHVPMLDQPKTVADDYRRFLQTVE